MVYEARTSTGTPFWRGSEHQVRALARTDALQFNLYMTVWKLVQDGTDVHVGTYEPRSQGQGSVPAAKSRC